MLMILTRRKKNPWEKAQSAPDFLAGSEQEVEWLVKDLLAPGAITEIFSPRGIGKSLVAHAMGIRLAKEGKRILLADRDNPPREVKRRMKKWGAKEAPTFRVMTRDEVPPLTDRSAWEKFPFLDYDLVIIDSLDSTAEGVGEQDSGKPSKAIAPVLDIAHRADGPAVLVLGNTVRKGTHGRGSGVVEDRADIVFEVRDATDLKPSGTKDWWHELPLAGAAHWATRASRRTKRDRYRLAFIPSKFRVGEEPDPFIRELDLSGNPWVLRDVTEEILHQGESALNRAQQEKHDRQEAAVHNLMKEVASRAEANDPLVSGDAVSFLMDRGLTQRESRQLIEDRKGVAWRIEIQENKPGHPKILQPILSNNPVSKVTTEDTEDVKPVNKRISEPPSSVTRMDTGPRKTGFSKPAPDGGYSGSCFPSVSLENPIDSSLEEDDSEVPVERF